MIRGVGDWQGGLGGWLEIRLCAEGDGTGIWTYVKWARDFGFVVLDLGFRGWELGLAWELGFVFKEMNLGSEIVKENGPKGFGPENIKRI